MHKELPNNIEAEKYLLGILLQGNAALPLIADKIEAKDFYRDAHCQIFEAMLVLYQRNESIDFITVGNILEQKNVVIDDGVGGHHYLIKLSEQAFNHFLVPIEHVEEYADIIVDRALARRGLQASHQAALLFMEEPAIIAQAKAETLFAELGASVSTSDFTPISEVVADCALRISDMHSQGGVLVGIPTKFHELDKMTSGLRDDKLILVAGRPGMGKCLTAQTLVDDPATGARITIEECVRRQLPMIHGLSEDGKMRSTAISHWIDSGVKLCYRVRTRLGRMVEVTGHHPFLAIEGWKPLHDLSVGDHIAVPTRIDCFGSDKSLHIDLVRLMAYYITEGGLTPTTPMFTNTDPAIIEDFRDIITNHFPALHVRQNGISYAACRPRNVQTMQRGAVLPKNPITTWLDELGLWGKLAQEKFFPACVWTWDKHYLAEFLRILMSCDGCIYSFQGNPIIEFTVASERLAQDLHHAFLRFGIISKLIKRSASWRVEITSPEQIKRYQEEIGWFGEKSQRFAEYEHVLTSRRGNNGHAPKEVWEQIRSAIKSQGISMVELARRSGETTKTGHGTGYNPHMNRSLPRHRLARYADALDDMNLRRASGSDVYWDEIVSIEPIGEHQVYDLTVPDGSNFIAQGIFVHNTSFALTLAHNAAGQGRKVGILSLEMSKDELVERLIAIDGQIDSRHVSTGNLESEEWEKFVASSDRLRELPISIDDTFGSTLMDLRSKAKRLQTMKGLDLLIVDYLQLMDADGKETDNEVRQLSIISRGLKGLARELHIPVVALAQLNRSVESRQSKVPQLSDLRGSGTLEQDADIVIFLYREEEYNKETERKGQADVIVAKHRGGPKGTMVLGWDETQTRFYNLISDEVAGRYQ